VCPAVCVHPCPMPGPAALYVLLSPLHIDFVLLRTLRLCAALCLPEARVLPQALSTIRGATAVPTVAGEDGTSDIEEKVSAAALSLEGVELVIAFCATGHRDNAAVRRSRFSGAPEGRGSQGRGFSRHRLVLCMLVSALRCLLAAPAPLVLPVRRGLSWNMHRLCAHAVAEPGTNPLAPGFAGNRAASEVRGCSGGQPVWWCDFMVQRKWGDGQRVRRGCKRLAPRVAAVERIYHTSESVQVA
jgi:hypothetical protein